MAQIYSKKTEKLPEMKPRREIISFLLNYSKSLKVIQTKSGKFEFIAN
ncbi:MAG: hypothetical protein AB7D46_08090 [Flavobacteriaceae bacterium]